MVPSVQDQMEGCPADGSLNMLYLSLSGVTFIVLFIVVMGIVTIFRKAKEAKKVGKLIALQGDKDFIALQVEMYGKRFHRLLRDDTSRTSLSTILGVSRNEFSWGFASHIDNTGESSHSSYVDTTEDGVVATEFDC